MDDFIDLIKRKGFHDTYKVFILSKRNELPLKDFYNELTEFSNYNSYLRIKDKLIEKELIEEVHNNGTKKIRLTDKGIDFYENLTTLANVL